MEHNRECREIDALKYTQLIFDKGSKAIQWMGGRAFSINGAEHLNIYREKKIVIINSDLNLTTYIKFNSKCFMGLNIKPKTFRKNPSQNFEIWVLAKSSYT